MCKEKCSHSDEYVGPVDLKLHVLADHCLGICIEKTEVNTLNKYSPVSGQKVACSLQARAQCAWKSSILAVPWSEIKYDRNEGINCY